MESHGTIVLAENEIRKIRERLRTIHDYPIAGFPFCDISPALALPDMLGTVTRGFMAALESYEFDFVLGIETRGLVFASPLAAGLRKGLVLARKSGRVAGPKVSVGYSSEYETAGTLELSATIVRRNARCVIVDDFLATGGTAVAAASLVEQVEGNVSAFVFFIEDRELNGRGRLRGRPVISALDF